MGQWANYFVATAGAAAALTGLIFVSVSLNLKKILSFKHLPSRALGSLILLINILVTSSFCLIPGQSLFWLGCEILVAGVFIWLFNSIMDFKSFRHVAKQYRFNYLQNLLYTQLAIGPYLVAGVLLINNSAAGFYWLIPGITCSFVKALLDAWVLLVEINR